MIQNIVTSIILYSGTAVDLLIILMLFFAKRKSRKDIINIYLGQFLGSVSLIFPKFAFAFVLNYIPSKEIFRFTRFDSNFPRPQSFAFRRF